jgi:hypothetical protein
MTHPENAGSVFVLRAIDPTIASIVQQVRIDTDRQTLCGLLEIPLEEFQPRAILELEPEAVDILVRHYQLDFNARDLAVELHPWHPIDDLPYQVHTGRELALMLAGTKPLAVFSDEHPSLHGLKIIPEREFEPYVAAGRFVKREDITAPGADAPLVRGQRLGTRRVLYALPREAWRIDAYLLLWATAMKSGWNAGFERMEGTLLGYGIDPLWYMPDS